MKKIIYLIFVFFILHFKNSIASDWEKLPVSGESGELRVLIDKSSVSVSGKYKKAWFWTMYSTAQILKKSQETWTSRRDLIYFNCRERTYSIIQSIYYDFQEEDVKLVGSDKFKVDADDFFEITPDSIGEEEFNRTCNSKIK